MKLPVVAAVLLAGALVPASFVSAKCARTEMRPVILTTRDTKLPDDGGILVGWHNETYNDAGDHSTDGKDPTDQPTWEARDGAKAKLALARKPLAPGLSVYKVAGAGAVTLVDKKGKTLATFTHDAKAAPSKMPPPAVASLTISVDKTERWSERHAVAKLTLAPPPEAIGIITYLAAKSGVDLPMSFARIADTHDKLMSIETFEDAGHCGTTAPNAMPPSANQKVYFVWVDAFGRLSPGSAPVTAR